MHFEKKKQNFSWALRIIETSMKLYFLCPKQHCLNCTFKTGGSISSNCCFVNIDVTFC